MTTKFIEPKQIISNHGNDDPKFKEAYKKNALWEPENVRTKSWFRQYARTLRGSIAPQSVRTRASRGFSKKRAFRCDSRPFIGTSPMTLVNLFTASVAPRVLENQASPKGPAGPIDDRRVAPHMLQTQTSPKRTSRAY